MATLLTPADVPTPGVARDPGVTAQPAVIRDPRAEALAGFARNIEALGEAHVSLLNKKQGAEDNAFLDAYQLEYTKRATQIESDMLNSSDINDPNFVNNLNKSLSETAAKTYEEIAASKGWRPSEDAKQRADHWVRQGQIDSTRNAISQANNQRISGILDSSNATAREIIGIGAGNGQIDETLARIDDLGSSLSGVMAPDKVKTWTDARKAEAVESVVRGLKARGEYDKAQAIVDRYTGYAATTATVNGKSVIEAAKTAGVDPAVALGFDYLAGVKTPGKPGPAPDRYLATPVAPTGMTAKGNIDLYGMAPAVQRGAATGEAGDLVDRGNRNYVVSNLPGTPGGYGGFDAYAISKNGQTILIPKVGADGQALTEKAATALFEQGGQHFGIFSDAASAKDYAKELHEQQAAFYTPDGNRLAVEPKGAQKTPQAMASPERTIVATTDQKQRAVNAQGYGERVTGTITVNGHTYQWGSGGGGRGSLPFGGYRIQDFMTGAERKAAGYEFTRDSFMLSDAKDPLIPDQAPRTGLLIHDSKYGYTAGCIGIMGDFQAFQADLKAEAQQRGGLQNVVIQVGPTDGVAQPKGSYVLTSPEIKQRVAQIAAYTTALTARLGTPPSPAEIYLADFVGVDLAVKMINAPEGNAPVGDYLPEAFLKSHPEIANLTVDGLHRWVGDRMQTAMQATQGELSGRPIYSDTSYVPISTANTLNNELAVSKKQDTSQLLDLTVDDVNSIRATGKGIGINPAKLNLLTEPQQRNYLENRQDAETYYNATKDIGQIPDDAIYARSDALQPKSGVGFTRSAQIAEDFDKLAKATIDKRARDPAAAVGDHPLVVDAYAKRDPQSPASPESWKRVLDARYAAQKSISIDPYLMQPLTKAEAFSMATPLRAATDMKEFGDRLDALGPQIEATYGDYADEVLRQILSDHINDPQQKALVSGLIQAVIARQANPSSLYEGAILRGIKGVDTVTEVINQETAFPFQPIVDAASAVRGVFAIPQKGQPRPTTQGGGPGTAAAEALIGEDVKRAQTSPAFRAWADQFFLNPSGPGYPTRLKPWQVELDDLRKNINDPKRVSDFVKAFGEDQVPADLRSKIPKVPYNPVLPVPPSAPSRVKTTKSARITDDLPADGGAAFVPGYSEDEPTEEPRMMRVRETVPGYDPPVPLAGVDGRLVDASDSDSALHGERKTLSKATPIINPAFIDKAVGLAKEGIKWFESVRAGGARQVTTVNTVPKGEPGNEAAAYYWGGGNYDPDKLEKAAANDVVFWQKKLEGSANKTGIGSRNEEYADRYYEASQFMLGMMERKEAGKAYMAQATPASPAKPSTFADLLTGPGLGAFIDGTVDGSLAIAKMISTPSAEAIKNMVVEAEHAKFINKPVVLQMFQETFGVKPEYLTEAMVQEAAQRAQTDRNIQKTFTFFEVLRGIFRAFSTLTPEGQPQSDNSPAGVLGVRG